MDGFLVAGGCFGIPISLDQNESRGIVFLLDDDEARDAGFQDAIAGIFDGGGSEGFYAFRLHVNMNNEHLACLPVARAGGKPVKLSNGY